MTRIESDQVRIEKSAEEVFNFLSDFGNIGKLMPDQVTGFEYDADTCKFTITGMATLGMKYLSKTPYSEIVIQKYEKAPFDFNLICDIKEITPMSTQLQMVFDADLNPFLKMMAERPLSNFLNMLLKKYQEISAS
jgi:carbon monoxide dehydrogenase subunit G